MRLSLFGQPDSSPDPLGVPGTERLLTLTDGVVAIALTLLVLQFKVPSLAPGTDPNSPHALYVALHLSGSLVSYVVAFYVIGQFWLAHHRVFRYISGHSESLAWWNFGFLFTITLFPFTSALLGSYSNNALAVVAFSVNLLLASISTTLVLGVAKHMHMLVPQASLAVLRGIRLRGLTSAVVIAASIVVAFFSPRDAQFVWILLIGSTRLARVWSNRSPVRSDGDGGGEAMAGGAGSPGEVATSTRLERER
ncbi:MAG TPA: TMEM175 family protein [Acidimicrobiales bacterium]|nr:TMEM175 family protein [Acidimicrobiales bacterium]